MEVDDCFRFFFWKFRRGLYVPTYNLEGFSLEINDFGKASTATKTLKRDFPSEQAPPDSHAGSLEIRNFEGEHG